MFIFLYHINDLIYNTNNKKNFQTQVSERINIKDWKKAYLTITTSPV